MKLRISRPAPISSITESASSAHHQQPAQVVAAAPDRAGAGDPRPTSFRLPWRSSRLARSAGSSPKRMPDRTDRPSVKSSTLAVDARSRAVAGTLFEPSTRIPASADERQAQSPSAPPATASSTLSVSSWRTIRPRLAPSAARTAISFCRASARDSSRFATFAQAMSSTKPTAPIRIDQRTPHVADDLFLQRHDAERQAAVGRVDVGMLAPQARRNRIGISACACAIDTPGFSLPMML